MKSAIGFTRQLTIAIAAVQFHCLTCGGEEPAAAAPGPAAENQWFIELAPFWRAGGDVNFAVKSLPDLSRHRPSVPASSNVGPFGVVADRTYEDGYVKRDYGTGVWDDKTWYFGYNSDTQIVGNQLVFQGNSYSLIGESIGARDSFSLDLSGEIGGEARVGRSIFASGGVTGTLVLGLGFSSSGGSADFEDLGYGWSSRREIITDTYNLLTDASILRREAPAPPLAPTPYRGTKDGPGYVIPNIPARRQVTAAGDSPLRRVYHSVHQDIDVDLWVLSLGLDVRGKGRKASYIVGAGLSALGSLGISF